jgi:hypothetical protein
VILQQSCFQKTEKGRRGPYGSSLILNTHRYVKQLMAVGMTEAQAEAQVEIFIHFISDKLVTKQALKETELLLKRDIKELDVKLETRIKELETRIKELDDKLETRIMELETNLGSQIKLLEKEIIIKLGGMMVIGITVLAAMIKFL